MRDLNAFAARAEEFVEGSGTRLKAGIVRRVSQIELQPFSGRVVPEYEALLLRELIHPPYRIVYEVFPDRVEIVAIRHGREQFEP